MPKEKNYNPVQAAKKAEKAKQLKKQKAQVLQQRTERLAKRNPTRLERDIEELKALEQSGELRPHDRQRLTQLERDLKDVRKAREKLGVAEEEAGRGRGRGAGGGDGGDRGGRERGRGDYSGLGKRRRTDFRTSPHERHGGGREEDSESSDTDPDVSAIPMPRDTPPPVPRRRFGRRDNPNEVPIEGARMEQRKQPVEVKKPTLVYEAAPQLRDLQKEATRFVPAAVRNKLRLAKGEGRLLGEEEFDRLEREGFVGGRGQKGAQEQEQDKGQGQRQNEDGAGGEGDGDVDIDAELAALEEEMKGGNKDKDNTKDDEVKKVVENVAAAAVKEAQFEMMAAERRGESMDERAVEKRLRNVEMEEVEDEDF